MKKSAGGVNAGLKIPAALSNGFIVSNALYLYKAGGILLNYLMPGKRPCMARIILPMPPLENIFIIFRTSSN